MDRVAAMLILLGMLVVLLLFLMALFARAPVFCSCVMSLLYTLYLFIANESAGIHHAQEFENRFWTIFATLFSTALFFANDSPIAIGRYNPSIGFLCVAFAGYCMHAYDRHSHRQSISRDHGLRRGVLSEKGSLNRLKSMGIPVQDQLDQISASLSQIDQLLIPSTVNNFINQRFILRKERMIINVFEEAEPKTLNYLIQHSKLGLIFYKVKDHRSFSGQHRTELIELLAVTRISVLTVLSKVLVLHALQMMKLPANTRSEYWVRNIILRTTQDDLSELKTLNDAKGDYFSMNKLIFSDIRSQTVRIDILQHFQKEANIQAAHDHMGTKKGKLRAKYAWRKILSDVDDTLYCSGGSYPAGIHKGYTKKTLYPGVLTFYRELDLGTQGPEEWPLNRVGNLVFLSARPHVYKDMSERHNFKKFKKLRQRGMHTIPSLLAGDIASGRDFMVQNDFEPLARKKFQNFHHFVSVYPEFKHVFIGDNGQGDVRAAELMYDAFPNQLQAVFIHKVLLPLNKTHGYNLERWYLKGFKPFFFNNYIDVALQAVRMNLIKMSGLRRVMVEAIDDFHFILKNQWPSLQLLWDRKAELNQSLFMANIYLRDNAFDQVPLIPAERIWDDRSIVSTPYGPGTITGFDPQFDMYNVDIDWRPLDEQLANQYNDTNNTNEVSLKTESGTNNSTIVARVNGTIENGAILLETVLETNDELDEDGIDSLTIEVKMVPSSQRTTIAAGIAGNNNSSTQTNPNLYHCDDDSISTHTEHSSSSNTSQERHASKDCTQFTSSSQSPQFYYNNTPMQTAKERASSQLQSSSSNTSIQHRSHYHKVTATIHRSYIYKYSPPTLPELPKNDEKGRSIFSFWVPSGENTNPTNNSASKDKNISREKLPKGGDKCNTPYGAGTIQEYRLHNDSVVVDFTQFCGRGYLQKNCVQINTNKGFLESLLSPFSTEKQSSFPAPPSSTSKEDFLRKGSKIVTPFGEGEVIRPSSKKRPTSGKLSKPSRSLSSSDTTPTIPVTTLSKVNTTHSPYGTLAVSLTSWTLSDGTHPVLYCTQTVATEWKDCKFDKTAYSGKSNLLSVFGSMMDTVRRISAPQQTPSAAATVASVDPKIPPAPAIPFDRYYKDGAAVTTQFGPGVVRQFRPSDGFYLVSLDEWTFPDAKSSPVAYLKRNAMTYRLAKGCREGYPVHTLLGLSGTLTSVEPITGVHIVSIPGSSMVCYLQPSSVTRPLKAAVGEGVFTPYGEGRVVKYRFDDDFYVIRLSWGAVVFSKAENFDRAGDGDDDGEGAPRWWLLKYFLPFSNQGENCGGGSQSRSRSNSVVSLSTRSIS